MHWHPQVLSFGHQHTAHPSVAPLMAGIWGLKSKLVSDRCGSMTLWWLAAAGCHASHTPAWPPFLHTPKSLHRCAPQVGSQWNLT